MRISDWSSDVCSSDLVPWLEQNEGLTDILAPTRRTESRHAENGLYIRGFLLKIIMLHLAHEVGCMIERRSRRHAHLGEHEALILIRQETAGQANEQQSHDRRDRAVDQEHSNRSRYNTDRKHDVLGKEVAVRVGPGW